MKTSKEPSEPTSWSKGHEPGVWTILIDGTAALFGLVSATLALTIAFLAVKGLSSYRELLDRIEQEVKQRLELTLETRVIVPAIAKAQAEVDKVISEKIKGAIGIAEKKLADELDRLSKDPAWREEFTGEVVKRVQEHLQPPATEITPNEFDPPHGNH